MLEGKRKETKIQGKRESPLTELSQEAQIVLVKEPNVVNAVAEHRQPLNSHPERIALPLLGVVADILENRGVNHAAAENLKPSRLFANWAALAFAKNATDQNFGARFGEGEMVRSEANLNPFSEKALSESVESPF